MTILSPVIAPSVALVFSPLFVGLINRTKAAYSGRTGPRLLQGYFDLARLLQKGRVRSKTTTWLFRAAPVVVFASTLAASAFVPVTPGVSTHAFTGDLVILLYLLAFARFFLILSALDTGSAFEGMGASREVFFACLAEPVAFVCLLNVMRAHNATTLAVALSAPMIPDSIAVILAALPIFLVLLAENARIPFDDPATHLELTMIHEVMILDNSGPDLALLEYATAVKIWLFALIIARILLPVPATAPVLQVAVLVGLMFALAVVIGTVESVMARVRLLKVPQLLFSAGVIAVLGFFISVTGAFTW